MLWRPFHRCLAKLHQGCNIKSDIIDVFITFFLLSYTKCVYLSIFVLNFHHVIVLDSQHHFIYSKGLRVRLGIDPRLDYLGKHYLPYGIFSMLALVLFIFLPSLFLILYPIRAFRSCLFKCHLDSISLNTFADKLQSCYRNGLDGGCDMRSLSGVFFNLRILVFTCLQVLYLIERIPRMLLLGIISAVISLTIALISPYQRTYMNVFDSLLFFNLGLLYLLVDSNLFHSVIARLLLIAPIICIVVLVLLRNLHWQLNYWRDKFKLYLCTLCQRCSRRIQQLRLLTTEQKQCITNSTSTSTQPLIQPGFSIEIMQLWQLPVMIIINRKQL